MIGELTLDEVHFCIQAGLLLIVEVHGGWNGFQEEQLVAQTLEEDLASVWCFVYNCPSPDLRPFQPLEIFLLRFVG